MCQNRLKRSIGLDIYLNKFQAKQRHAYQAAAIVSASRRREESWKSQQSEVAVRWWRSQRENEDWLKQSSLLHLCPHFPEGMKPWHTVSLTHKESYKITSKWPSSPCLTWTPPCLKTSTHVRENTPWALLSDKWFGAANTVAAPACNYQPPSAPLPWLKMTTPAPCSFSICHHEERAWPKTSRQQ